MAAVLGEHANPVGPAAADDLPAEFAEGGGVVVAGTQVDVVSVGHLAGHGVLSGSGADFGTSGTEFDDVVAPARGQVEGAAAGSVTVVVGHIGGLDDVVSVAQMDGVV